MHLKNPFLFCVINGHASWCSVGLAFLFGLFFPLAVINNNNSSNDVLHMLGAFYSGISNLLAQRKRK